MARRKTQNSIVYSLVNFKSVLTAARPKFETAEDSCKIDNQLKYYGNSFLCYNRRGGDDLEVIAASPEDSMWLPPSATTVINPPFDQIVDVNLERNTIVYECILGRDLGIDFIQDGDFVVVGNVTPGSKAATSGIEPGDRVIATSATAGDQMWAHNSVEGIKSALNTRFVMSSTVKVRMERLLSTIAGDSLKNLQVPYSYDVKLKRPLGIHVIEGPQGGVFVQSIKPDLGAASSRLMEVGDQS
eukprot:gene5489-11036_t